MLFSTFERNAEFEVEESLEALQNKKEKGESLTIKEIPKPDDTSDPPQPIEVRICEIFSSEKHTTLILKNADNRHLLLTTRPPYKPL